MGGRLQSMIGAARAWPVGTARFMTRPAPKLLVAAQAYPILLLSIVFALIAPQVAADRVSHTSLLLLIVDVAVVSPLLAQSAAGAMHVPLNGVDRADRARVVAIGMATAPRAVLLATPLAVAAAVLLGETQRMDPLAIGATAVLVVLQLVMSTVMVGAYVLRAPALLVLGWSAYGGALLAAPASWWLPPCAATVAQLVALVPLARRRDAERPAAPIQTLAAAGAGGLLEGVPLWIIPVSAVLLGTRTSSIGVTFLALVPAIVAQQVYFIGVAEPLWRTMHRLQLVFTTATADVAARAAASMTLLRRRRARIVSIVALLLANGVAGGALLIDAPGAPRFAIAVLAGATASILMIGCHLYSIARSRAASVFAAAIDLGLLATCAFRGIDAIGFLELSTVLNAVALIAVSALNRTSWQRPEYWMFWRGALAQ